MDVNAKNKEQPISDRPLEEIYLEVICKVKEKIPDADCRCISIPGYDGADYFYVQRVCMIISLCVSPDSSSGNTRLYFYTYDHPQA